MGTVTLTIVRSYLGNPVKITGFLYEYRLTHLAV